MGTVLIVLLVLLLIGALPAWPYSSGWGYFPSGGLGLVVLIVLILALTIAALAASGPAYAQSSMTDKAKTMTQEAKTGMSDSWLTSKTKIALFSDDRVKGRQVHVETKGGVVYLRGKVDT